MLGGVADLLADLGGSAVPLLGRLDGVGRHPAGRLVVRHSANELDLGCEEYLEQLAHLRRVRWLVLRGGLVGIGMDGGGVLLGFVPLHQELLTGGWRAGGLTGRRCAKAGTAHPGHSHSGHARHPTKLRVRRRNGNHRRQRSKRKDPAECHRYSSSPQASAPKPQPPSLSPPSLKSPANRKSCPTPLTAF